MPLTRFESDQWHCSMHQSGINIFVVCNSHTKSITFADWDNFEIHY